MSSSLVDSPVHVARTVSAWALPWLFSTTTHIGLLLALAVAYHLAAEALIPAGPSAGKGIHAVFITSGADGGDGNDDMDAPGSGYYDDEPPLMTAETPERRDGGGSADASSSAALNSLLNEK